MGDKGIRKLIPFVFLIFIIGSVSSTAVVNSQDWKDIYSGVQYSYDQGHDDVYFVRGPYGQAVMEKMPEGDITLVESSDTPMAKGFESKLETEGYSVNRKIKSENLNIELSDTKDSFIVVPEDYPSAGIAAAPVARSEDSWVLIVNEENIAEVNDIISGADGNVLMAGDFSRDIRNTLEKNTDEKIIEPNRFKLSVRFAERLLLDKTETRKAFLADGSFLETELISGKSPVLLSGTNLISEPVENFLTREPEHDIRNIILFGNQLTQVGKQLSNTNITKNNQSTDEQPNVFVKFGTARGDSSRIMALNLFPLPQGNISLDVTSNRYDPASQRLFITYENTGSSRMYEITSFRVLQDGETVGSAADENPVFIAGNDKKTRSYKLELSPSEYKNAEIEFSTSFGSSPENLNTYLTESGEFSPPLTKNLTVNEIEDSSNVSFEDISYSKGLKRFILKVRNEESSSAFVQTDLLNVNIQGQEQSLSSDVQRIPPKSDKKLYIPVELDNIDIEQNSNILVDFRYGENRDILPRGRELEKDLKVKSGIVESVLTNRLMIVTVLTVFLISILGYWKRKLVARIIVDYLEDFAE